MSPTVTFCKLAGTVGTVVGGNMVAVVKLVGRRCQTGLQSVRACISLYVFHNDTIAQLGYIIFYDVLFVSVLHIIVAVRDLVTGHYADGVLVEGLVVLQQLVAGNGQIVVLLRSNTTQAGCITVILVIQ